MSAVARRPHTSAMDLAEARPMKRLKRRPPPPPPAAAASSIRPEPSSMRPEPFSLRPEPVEGRARLRGSSRRLPVWAARAVFLLGLLNIASAVLRRSPRLLDWSQDYLPPFGAVASVAVVGIGVGCGLLVMARGLRRRKHRALIATVALLGAAIAVHLARGTELIQAAVSAAVVVVLLLGRRQFVGRPDPSSRSAIPLSLFGLGFAAWLLGAVTLITDHHELVRPWTGAGVLQQSLLGMAGISGPLRFVNADAAAESRYLLAGLGMLAGLAALGVLLHSSAPIKTANDSDRHRIRALLAQHGQVDSLGYFATRGDKSYVFSATGKAAVAYRVKTGVCLAAGDPIGDVEAWPGAIEAWLQLTQQRAWIPAVLAASETGAAAYHRSGLDALEIGDEAVVEVADFTLDGRAMRSVRQAVNRARRAGYEVRIDPVWDLDPTHRMQAEQLSQRWRRGSPERGFSMALSRFAADEDPDCLIVQARNYLGELVAVLQFVPWGNDGLSLDLVRRHPELENGVMELMIAELLASAPGRGVTRVSLNFAVFRSSLARGERIGAGPFLRAWVRLLLVASRWWQIASLYRANAKFRPAWEPRFICFALARDLGPIIGAALALEGFLHWPRLTPRRTNSTLAGGPC
jgi:lysyl-tRNA synthetase class 2